MKKKISKAKTEQEIDDIKESFKGKIGT